MAKDSKNGGRPSPSMFDAMDDVAYNRYYKQKLMDGEEPLGRREWYKKYRRGQSRLGKIKEDLDASKRRLNKNKGD